MKKKQSDDIEDEAEVYARNLESKIRRKKKKEKLENEDFDIWLREELLDDYLNNEQ